MIENGQPDGSYLLHYGGLAIPFHVQYRETEASGDHRSPGDEARSLRPSRGRPGSGAGQGGEASQVDRPSVEVLRAVPASPAGRRFVSGETHVYLGRQYRLKVQVGSPRA